MTTVNRNTEINSKDDKGWALKTTGIGSLPHHNIDAALSYSFQFDIPYLPQIPKRNAWEFMIPQALDGLPGLRVDEDGMALLDLNVWSGRFARFNDKLLNAFNASKTNSEAFAAFEPSSASCSSWQPFLWEIEDKKISAAKLQLAGPMTSVWALKSTEALSPALRADLQSQIFKLILARAIAMTRRLLQIGISPIFFLDEPALYAYHPTDPSHALGFQELRIAIQSLKKEGATVGLHCCSNTQWGHVLGMGLDLLSLDCQLSLKDLLSKKELVTSYIQNGGRFAFGVVPTTFQNQPLEELGNQLYESFVSQFESCPELRYRVCSTALYTPACGLAMTDPAQAEATLSLLQWVQKRMVSSLK